MFNPNDTARATPYYFGVDPVSLFILFELPISIVNNQKVKNMLWLYLLMSSSCKQTLVKKIINSLFLDLAIGNQQVNFYQLIENETLHCVWCNTYDVWCCLEFIQSYVRNFNYLFF